MYNPYLSSSTDPRRSSERVSLTTSSGYNEDEYYIDPSLPSPLESPLPPATTPSYVTASPYYGRQSLQYRHVADPAVEATTSATAYRTSYQPLNASYTGNQSHVSTSSTTPT